MNTSSWKPLVALGWTVGAVCVRRPTYIAIPFLLRNKNRPLTALVVAYFVLTSSAWCLLYAAWTVPAALLWCMWATGADEQELPRMKAHVAQRILRMYRSRPAHRRRATVCLEYMLVRRRRDKMPEVKLLQAMETGQATARQCDEGKQRILARLFDAYVRRALYTVALFETAFTREDMALEALYRRMTMLETYQQEDTASAPVLDETRDRWLTTATLECAMYIDFLLCTLLHGACLIVHIDIEMAKMAAVRLAKGIWTTVCEYLPLAVDECVRYGAMVVGGGIILVVGYVVSEVTTWLWKNPLVALCAAAGIFAVLWRAENLRRLSVLTAVAALTYGVVLIATCVMTFPNVVGMIMMIGACILGVCVVAKGCDILGPVPCLVYAAVAFSIGILSPKQGWE